MSADRPSLVVAGGGIAGVEALLGAHRHLADRVDLTLVAPDEDFVYRPLAVGRPFSVAHALEVPLRRIAADTGATLVRGAVERVDLAGRTVRTSDGDVLAYDALLLAVGARMVPGVTGATTWLPHAAPEQFGGLLRDLEEGWSKSIAFVVPPGPTWPLPVYELALMTASAAEAMGQRVEVHVVTPEREPLALFGAVASEAVRQELQSARVRLHAGTVADVRGGHPRVVALLPDAGELRVDRVVSLPLLAGPDVQGVPVDDLGFVQVDDQQQVLGGDGAYAAGDGTDFPIKYGGLATHQARRALAAIAAQVGGTVPDEPEVPHLRGTLMTGRRARGLGGASPTAAAHLPLWTPAGKVEGRYLPDYLNGLDVRLPDAPATVAGDVAVDEPLRAPHRAEAAYLYELGRAARVSPDDLARLGRRMHAVTG